MKSPIKVKVCGIRSYEDARCALDAGAWALGFVFHRPSPRYIEPREAARIVARLPAAALTVGVFVDRPLAELNEVLETAGLRGAQLHGAEDPSFARRVRADLVIKALRVGKGFDAETARDFHGFTILLDTFHEGLAGGTGESFDWREARRVGEITPFLLAGGLSPENVTRALEAARPEGIDLSGGLERAPGVKDHEKIRRLFAAVRAFEETG